MSLALVGSPEPEDPGDGRDQALFDDVGGYAVPNGAAMTAEADLQDEVESLARFYHLLYIHCFRFRGDRGFPDLVLVGPRGMLFRELKVQGRQPAWDQKRWGKWLQNAGCDWAIWTEDDYASGRITDELAAISYLAVIGQVPRRAA
jgi:hypothetical protein